MKRLLITHINQLVQVQDQPAGARPLFRAGAQMAQLPCLDNAWLLVEDGRIAGFGPMATCPTQSDSCPTQNDSWQQLDAAGGTVFPSFCDCHTHLVYAGSREQEFVDKLHGLTYEQIAARGGGILNSAQRLHQTSEEALYQQLLQRVHEVVGFGTGAVEIKSGYGLTVEDELKMLRVIRRLQQQGPLAVKATFLGAHAVPAAYKECPRDYVDLIINQMIPQVAAADLAEYIDVFCEQGFFSVEDTERLFMAGLKYGLIPRVHANQMHFSGGVQVGVKYGAATVDHLEHTGPEEWKALAATWADVSATEYVPANAGTMPVLLPGATFFLQMDYAPARAMLEQGLPLALASNYNPGSCPAGDVRFMMSLACLYMKLTPEEALNAATLNGAYAMGLAEELGSIAVGKRAHFFITKPIPSYAYLTYAFTSPLVDKVVLDGQIIEN